MSHLPRYVTVLASALGEDVISDDGPLNERMRNILLRVKSAASQAYMAGWSAVSDEDKARVQHIL